MSENLFNRQEVLTIVAQLTPDNVGDGLGVSAKLPQGAVVVDVVALAGVAFNTAGTTPTATLTVTDGTTAFVSAQSVTTAGVKTTAVRAKHFPTGGTITANVTQGAASGLVAATAGSVSVVVSYVQHGAGKEIYG